MKLVDFVILTGLIGSFFLGRAWERGSVLIDSIKDDQARDGFCKRERLP